MATAHVYNHTKQLFMAGNNVQADNYNVILLGAGATFDPTHTTVTQVVGANEVSGNGWPAGGFQLQNVSISIVDTDDGGFSADDIDQAIAGGSLGPFSHYLITNATDDTPLVLITLTSPLTVPDGNNIRFPWVNGRIFTLV